MAGEAAQIQRRRENACLRAAQLYYLQNLTMATIAREMHTSRSTVSRLLSHARATGLVSIEIRSSPDGLARLEDEIMHAFKVSASVVPVPDDASEVDRLDRVAVSAARLLEHIVDSGMVVGVAWGATVTAVSKHLTARSLHDVVVVQLQGAGNTQTTGIVYASDLLRRFGEAYGATVQQFPVPALFDDPATKAAMWRERGTRRVLDLHRRMDVAVFGIGCPFAALPSHVYAAGYLDDRDHALLVAEGVVGDVATVFFRADGSHRDVTLNARSTGPGFDQLRKTPRRVAVVAGPAKAPSLRGALTAGVITDLIVDESTARALLRDPGRPSP